MSTARIHHCTDPAPDAPARQEALTDAVAAVREGELIVLPTDTVYGIGADAFDAEAVAALLAAKGRGRDFPPPVLISDAAVMDALAIEVPAEARALAQAFWPGALTLVLLAQPALRWDLGDTDGTVALRMPDQDLALDLLRRTGPLAVSSANKHGEPSALSAGEAHAQLGDEVAVYLDGGPTPGNQPSTIVDCTGPRLTVLRAGALSLEQLRGVVADIDPGVSA